MSAGLLDAAQRLAEVLTRENDALKRMQFASAVALASTKEAAIVNLMAQRRMPALSPALVALSLRLNKLTMENKALLEHSLVVQTRIVRIVARAGALPPAIAEYGGNAASTPSRRANALALSTRA